VSGHDPYAALRIPNFRWYTLGALALTLAGQVQELVVSWQVYDVTRDPLSLGLIGLAEALPFIGHVAIRNRGTIGGSLAHADPAAELPAIAVALRARFRLRKTGGDRWVNASDFFGGLFTTLLEPDEILVEVAIPPLPARTGWSFMEIARRHGDYAQIGVAALVTLDDSGQCRDARLVYLSVGDVPFAAQEAAGLLAGQEISPQAITAAADKASNEIHPFSDIHATADFKRHLARVLTGRALRKAVERANRRAA